MRTFATIILGILICSSISFAQTERYPELKVGDMAPDFDLPFATKDSLGTSDIRLSTLVGEKNIVLAFYPADWSGGCTKEICTLRDNFSDLAKLNSNVIGISGDYVYTHHEWAKHHNLPFILASDHKHEVASRYRSFNETTGYNKRTVYVVNKEGKIAYIDLMYSTKDMTSFDKLQDALKDLQ